MSVTFREARLINLHYIYIFCIVNNIYRVSSRLSRHAKNSPVQLSLPYVARKQPRNCNRDVPACRSIILPVTAALDIALYS